MASESPARPMAAVSKRGDLHLRVIAMQQALERTRAAMPVIRRLDPRLASRLGARSENRTGEVIASLQAANPDDLADCERRLRAGAELVEETLAFLAAAGARRAGLDQGITTFALKWLDELSDVSELPQVAVVIPAVTDITGMTTSIVRLRIPCDGIWGLPVAVHEYGHFVAAHLIRRQTVEAITRSVMPVEDLLHSASTAAERPVLYAHGQELFADAFAAATAGPAYTHYCIRYRFSPAAGRTDTHPSALRRVHTQLTVLNQIASTDPSGYLASEVSVLERRWAAALAATGAPPDEPDDAELDKLENDLITLVIEDETLSRVIYGDHLSACELAERWLQAEEHITIAHIVNAAWHARSMIEREAGDTGQAVAQINTISARAYDLLGKAA